jgi:phage baseplate assembly protein W
MAVYTDVSLARPTTRALSKDLEVVYQSVLAILNTRKGERLFRPDFGNTLEDSLFELVDEVSALEVFRRLVEDVSSQEPRASVNLPLTTVTANPVKGTYKLVLVLDVVGLSSDRLVFSGELSRRSN